MRYMIFSKRPVSPVFKAWVDACASFVVRIST